jgi:hypothetical protein
VLEQTVNHNLEMNTSWGGRLFGGRVDKSMPASYSSQRTMVMDAADRFARGYDLNESKVWHHPAKARCYTFPTKDELKVSRAKGVKFVDADGGEIGSLFWGTPLVVMMKIGRRILKHTLVMLLRSGSWT